MAKDFPYDHPTYTARNGAAITIPGVLASVVAAKFVAFAATRVKKISLSINVAGTNDGAGYDIFNGTASIGEIVTGTATSGSTLLTFTPSSANATVAAGSFIAFKTKANSATVSAGAVIEYEVVAGSPVT